MPTEELENELRRVLNRAAADIPDPRQAGQRLLGRDYHPRGGHRRLATASPPLRPPRRWCWAWPGSTVGGPAHGTGTISTAAFTLITHANGTATLTINSHDVVRNPGTLQRDLRQAGIPAIVTTGGFCSSDPIPAGFPRVVPADSPKGTFTIDAAAMPVGTELSFGNFQLSPPQGWATEVELIDAHSYSCTRALPTPPPAGQGVLLWWHPGEPGAQGFPGAGQ
jgi:hypothetical protein